METPIAFVDWSCRPTDFDSHGCDGMFIEKVRLKSFAEMNTKGRLQTIGVWAKAIYRIITRRN